MKDEEEEEAIPDEFLIEEEVLPPDEPEVKPKEAEKPKPKEVKKYRSLNNLP